MPRTSLLSFAALHAVVSLASRRSENDVVVIIRVPVVVKTFFVHTGEEVRDRNVLRTSVSAVAAGCAGDQVFTAEDVTNLLNHFKLSFAQWLEILHERNIVAHLLHVAHG